MWRWLVLPAGAVLIGAVLVACGGDNPAPSATDDGTPTTTLADTSGIDLDTVDLDSIDFAAQVHWRADDFGGWVPDPPSDEQKRFFATLISTTDERYLPHLTELARIPGPYTHLALSALRERFPGDEPFETRQLIVRHEVSDDATSYLDFKRALAITYDPRHGEFLDPALPRTISAQEVVRSRRADEIVALDTPGYLTADQAAAWINDSDVVIGISVNGDARAYPRRILDWHEMVNDVVGGVPVSLASCSLCGSAILFDTRVGGQVYHFGTSGLLYRSNKLMFDRETGALWDQFAGEPAWGALVDAGIQLRVLPSVQTTWADWLAQNPDTLVLDIETGFNNRYHPGDGFGLAYIDYYNSANTIFPAPLEDDRLAGKDWIHLVRVGDEAVAYPIERLAQLGFVQDEIGGVPVVVLATGGADGSNGASGSGGGRAYAAGEVRFVEASDGAALSDDGRSWQVSEEALIGPAGERLERLPSFNAFWFAVVNLAAETRLFEG